MFAALQLARRSVPVQIVDTGLWPCSHSYALALHPKSLELLKETGLAERIWETANPVETIGFYDASGRKAQIRIPESCGSPIAVIRQSALEDMLEKALGELDVSVLWKHEVPDVSFEDSHVFATVHKLRKKFEKGLAAEAMDEWVRSRRSFIEADFAVGADGHNSQVRRALGLEFPEVGPAQYYAVFEFQSHEPASHEARVVLGERTTDVLWPLPDGYYRWSFQLPDYSDTEAEQLKDRLLSAGFGHFPTKRLKDRVPASVEWGVPPALDRQYLEGLIRDRAPWFTGSIDGLSWRTIVRFEKRLASRFGAGRIWLAGDSAHLALPAGVQSMNTGLQEVSELAASFSRILAGESDTTELESYNERWTAEWRRLQGLERTLQGKPGADAWIASRADRIISCLPGHGTGLAQLAEQLGLRAGDHEPEQVSAASE